MLRVATPLTLGALSGIYCERVGRGQHRHRGHDARRRLLRLSRLHLCSRSRPAQPTSSRASPSAWSWRCSAACCFACCTRSLDHLQGRPDHQRHGDQHPGRGPDRLSQPGAVLPAGYAPRAGRAAHDSHPAAGRPAGGRAASSSSSRSPSPRSCWCALTHWCSSTPAGACARAQWASIRCAADTVGINVISRCATSNVLIGGADRRAGGRLLHAGVGAAASSPAMTTGAASSRWQR